MTDFHRKFDRFSSKIDTRFRVPCGVARLLFGPSWPGRYTFLSKLSGEARTKGTRNRRVREIVYQFSMKIGQIFAEIWPSFFPISRTFPPSFLPGLLPVGGPVRQPACRPVGLSAGRTLGWWVGRPADWPTGRPAGRLADRPTGRPTGRLTGRGTWSVASPEDHINPQIQNHPNLKLPPAANLPQPYNSFNNTTAHFNKQGLVITGGRG